MNLRDAGFVPALSTALLPRGSLALADFGVPLDLACWLAPFFIFGVVPLLDELCGTERYNAPSDAQLAALESRLYFRMLTMLVVPVWLATLVWCTWQFTQLPLGLVGKLGWLVSTSLIGGVLAINPAHELIHKPGRLEPLLGGILPTSAGYQGFKVEHVRGHHVHVATAHDSSSARLGESVYAFVPRALWLNVRNAWRLEAGRLRERGLPVWSWRNEMIRWNVL